MPIFIEIPDSNPVLVELRPNSGRGEREVARSLSDLTDLSTEALNKAMAATYGMAVRVVNTIKQINVADRPSTVEVEFGLKLTTEANALLVNAGTEAQIVVTLTWKQQPDGNET